MPRCAAWLLSLGLLWPADVVLAQAGPDYRFRTTADGSLGKVPLGPQVLSAEERAYLARLPELRVAIPLPAAAPYETIDAAGVVGGIHPDMLVALARAFGLRLKPVPFATRAAALQATRDGGVDLLMTIGVNAERLEYLAFTLGVSPRPGALFARPGARVDLDRATFVAEQGFLVVDWLRRQHPGASIVEVPSTLEALRLVASGGADAYLGSFLEATAVLARDPVPGVEVNRMLGYGSGFHHFALRKELAPLVAVLNKGIQTLRGSAADELLAFAPLPPGAEVHKPMVVSAPEAALLAARPVWRVGAVKGLALLNEIDERGLHRGIAAEYAEQVAHRLGVALQVRAFDSAAQMLDGLRLGEIDLIPFLTRTDERSHEFAFSVPYVEMPYTLVARSDAPQWWSLDSLRGKRLALAPEHPLRPLLARDFADIRVVDAEGGNGAMEMVIRGDAEAAVEVKLFANLRVNGSGGERLRILSEVSELPAQFHFAALRGEETMLGLVNRALSEINPGERQRIFRRWVAVDLTPAFPWRRHAPTLAVALLALLGVAGGTAWWTARLKREVKARQRSEALLTDIATQVPGVAFRYVVDSDGSLRHHWYSPGAKAFLGIEPDPQVTLLTLLAPYAHPEDLPGASAAQVHSQATGEAFQYTARFKRPGGDGALRWLQAHAVMARGPAGRQIWTGYIVDVSAERELQQRLAREAESRSLMLASASHELRAPTHTLSLALQAMPLRGLDDEQRHALQVAQDSAVTLAELLNDVLDAAREASSAASGPEPLRLRPRSFDLHQLLGDLGRAWRAAAHSKGLRFEIELAAGVPRTATTDPLRLKQVLINLLSNACKYTQAGSVTLRAAVSGGHAVDIAVIDTGIGITPAEQQRLFQPFATAEDPRAGPLAGDAGRTGLGLATARRIADLLGATLTLASTPGLGTTVTLRLPLAPMAAMAPARSAGTETDTGAVVVCDDDDTSRVLLAQMLRVKGFATHETGASSEALALWRAGGVRALVSDLDMPGMNGLELIRTLRAEEQARAQAHHPAGARTVVIVCSGSPVPAADASGNNALYDAYLVKPVQVSTLTDTLARLGVAA